MTDERRTWVPVLAGAVVAAVAASLVFGFQPRLTASAPYLPWIEARASGVFDPATPQLRGVRAHYRVDAKVLLPLGFTSLQIMSRQDVGMAVASYRDCAGDGGELTRAFEFFSASRPERARGVDRRGFFREAVRVTPGGVAWTAYFGAMTSWPEKSLSDARKAINGPQPHTYEAIDGLSTPLEMRSSVFDVAADKGVTSPADLWVLVRRQLEARTPRYVNLKTTQPQKPLPAMAFLGALENGLRDAAVHRDRPRPASQTRMAFTYNGDVRYLELVSMTRDSKRGQAYATRGLARNAADVFDLRFRIINANGEESPFLIWAELPANFPNDPRTPPIAPLGWEMELRSYLKLVFDRIG